MPEMKGKVSPGWARPVQLSTGKSAKKSSKKSCEISAKPSDQSSVGGLAPAQIGSAAEQREVMVLRVRRFSLWALLGLSAAAPLAPACGQNLDAGKPASQIFAEVCADFHRSPPEFKA